MNCGLDQCVYIINEDILFKRQATLIVVWTNNMYI